MPEAGGAAQAVDVIAVHAAHWDLPLGHVRGVQMTIEDVIDLILIALLAILFLGLPAYREPRTILAFGDFCLS